MKTGFLTGIRAALASALFLGMAPIFGKQAISFGFSPMTVVALRTSLATILLLLIVAIFKRQFLTIFPVGLIGCVLAGAINGLGSIFYYMALGRLTASLGQLLYAMYPLFVAIWLMLDRQPPGRLTIIRMILSTLALILLANTNGERVDPTGILLMLAASAMYALHLPINQRVLYEVPAPTVTLYTLLSMSAVVVPAYLIFDRSWPVGITLTNWWPILGLTLVTFLSRLALFLGVKHLGGMQTALLGLGELLVTVLVGHWWLHDTLSPLQWIGAAGLIASLLLVSKDRSTPSRRNHQPGGLLGWLRPPGFPSDIPWEPRE
jgi:drug/metabolite transporter (DMT)-like permease